MKRIFITLFLSFTILTAFSAHIKGGFFTYEYLGPGMTNPSYLRYKIRLTVYMSCNPSPGQLSNPIKFTIFQGNATILFANPTVFISNRYELNKFEDEPCISLDQRGCYYTVVEYELNNYELPVSAAGYTFSAQRCCRIGNMENVQNSGTVGSTYTITIPGTNSLILNANKNSSPNFKVNDTAVVCGGSYFTYPVTATDKDGDSLSYSLCAAFDGGSTAVALPDSAKPPPYQTINYSSPFFGSSPMGNGVTINPITGVLSGIAPIPKTPGGEFVVTVCVSEFRGGFFLAQSRKELHIQVKDCSPVTAYLAPKAVTCDGFTMMFSNSASNYQTGITYLWEFGDTASGVKNTSNLEFPTHAYADTGVYKIKLTVSISGLCSSSDTLWVGVYPGFFPNFTAVGPFCKGVPFQFKDSTFTKYGQPANWRWDFGNTLASNDTSLLQNPKYVFPAAGNYKVQLIVGSSFGCKDTVTKTITINNNPAIKIIPHDTLICANDALQLKTNIITGSFIWSPDYNINSTTSPSPIVTPLLPTKYFLNFTDQFGCINTDSMFVNVKTMVYVYAGNDTTICRGDSILLKVNSDALTFKWTPATYLTSDTAKQPLAFPLDALTTYHLVGSIGTCTNSDDITISTLPYPAANAGKDTTVCYGFRVPLNATGGLIYRWSPATFLSATNIPNPVAINPTATTLYVVAVTNLTGCLKPAFDSVIINVDPFVVANAGPSDTTVVLGEPLYLNGTGGDKYLWQPATWLTNANVFNPTALPKNNITYKLLVTSIAGCTATDTINIKVYNVPPSFYVPTAFSPNNDGKNDNIKPIILGMRSLDYFKVYNRWGKLVFVTTKKGAGWDGTINGNAQDAGTYVWLAKGTTFTGEIITKKGYVILLR